jgi:uncharacterized damage-inducible protein DinB
MSDELRHYRVFLDDQHQQIEQLIADLPPEALDWRPMDGEGEATNSLAVLVTHALGAERYWVAEVFGGQSLSRDRDAEFRVSDLDLAALRADLARTGDLVRDVLTTAPAERLDQTVTLPNRTVTRRWAVLHALEHIALHLGHMQLTRQLWRGRAGGGAAA